MLSKEAATSKDIRTARKPMTSPLTHRTFAVIAGILRDAAPLDAGDPLAGVFAHTGREMHSEIVGRFADALAATNPRFDRQRFYDACNVSR